MRAFRWNVKIKPKPEKLVYDIVTSTDGTVGFATHFTVEMQDGTFRTHLVSDREILLRLRHQFQRKSIFEYDYLALRRCIKKERRSESDLRYFAKQAKQLKGYYSYNEIMYSMPSHL